MNQVFLSGNLGQNPEILESSTGRYGSFSIAVNRVTGKDEATGEWKQETLWVNCRFGDSIAKQVEGLKIAKGDQVFVSGELRMNEREGKQYWFVQISKLEAGRRSAKNETQEPKPVAAGVNADEGPADGGVKWDEPQTPVDDLPF